MKRWLLVSLCAAAVVGQACKSERSQRVAASYSSVTQPTYREPPKREPQKVLVGVEGIPTEEEYEDRAATSISEANVDAKLAELEKEMSL